MATIFYSLAGEGRGHATRTKAVVDDLRRRHRVVLFASGQAASLLGPIYAGTDVELRRIEGLSFRYRPDGSVDYPGSAIRALRALPAFRRRIAELRGRIELERPDLVVTDFEPLLPRAAARAGVPCLSVDHQQFLTTCSLRELPLAMRLRAALISIPVGLLAAKVDTTVVSAFFRPPLRPAKGANVRQVGVLLGQDVLERTPTDEGFVLAYLRRGAPGGVLRALADSGAPARVYGPGKVGVEGTLDFRAIDRAEFVADLARCRALVSTAGNQVVGEALHLGKPVLALPEPGNWEQGLNGAFLERMGVGMCVPMDALRPEGIRAFLARLDGFRAAMPRGEVGGNAEVSRIIEERIAALAPGRGAELPSWRGARSGLQRAAA